ncbi:MAG TPA: sterol desaturase family protein [Xanthomonadaceae bacterium]|nr:sterol desaturase family protein [Xanthomonadaceae bacterium]
MAALPDQVVRYRETYRDNEIPRGYRGWLHFAFTFGVGSAALVWSAWQVDAPTPLEWLTVPLTFLYANFSEYWGHRTAMHRPLPGLGLIYKRHAGQHHRFFTHEAMPLDSSRDFRAVLFPPSLAFFFFAAFALPVWWLLSLLASDNVGWLFVATALFYFLNYEILHLAWHVPADSRLLRIPGFSQLQSLHRTHHDPALMTRYNFNITYPICDLLFGTLYRERREP